MSAFVFTFLMGVALPELLLLIMIIGSIIYLFIGRNKILKWTMAIFLAFIVVLVVSLLREMY